MTKIARGGGPVAIPEKTKARARRFAEASMAPNTRRAYAADWRRWDAWCSARGVDPMPPAPEAVAAYLTEWADTAPAPAVSTLRRALSALNQAAFLAGHPKPRTHPAVAAVMSGIARELGTRAKPKDAATVAEVRAMVRALPDDTLIGIRDRAILLVGFASAARRSELAALEVADLEPHRGGVTLHIRRSKSDQAGAGRVAEVARGENAETCPVTALTRWIDAAGIESGPVFRRCRAGRMQQEALSGRAIGLAVKRAAKRAGLAGDFGAHSLRSGHATTARENGARREDLRRQGGWKSDATLDRYLRVVDARRDTTSRRLGL